MPDDSTPLERGPWLDLPAPPVSTSDARRARLAHFRQPPHRVPEHVSPAHILCINTGAVTTLESTIAGRRAVGRSRPGDIGLYPAGLPQTFRWHEPAEFLQIHLDPAYLDRIGAELHGQASTTFVPQELADDALLTELVSSLHRLSSSGAPVAERYTEALAEALATHLVHRYAHRSTTPRRRPGGLAEGALRRVIDHIEAHVGQPVTVEELAAIAGCSDAHFSRSFKRRTGLSPHRYHIERRLERARELLAGTDESIVTIALAVGFSSQSHLTRHFTRRSGLPPDAFRRRQRFRANTRSKRAIPPPPEPGG